MLEPSCSQPVASIPSTPSASSVLTVLTVLTVLSVLSVSSLHAQNPAPPRCDTPLYRQFDFWIGDWNVTGIKGKMAGTNLVTLEEDGCVLHEHWNGTGGSTGQSFNFYDRTDKKWHQVWVDNSGSWLNLSGEFSGGKMVLVGTSPGPKGTPQLQRITFSKNADGSVHQVWDTSDDEGKTWAVAFDGLYRKK
jgi:hypothetical protein